MKTVLIFHHTDLDGMGVKILGMKYAESKNLPYKTFKCSYMGDNGIDTAVIRELHDRTFDEVAEVIIGDISIKSLEAQNAIQEYYNAGVPVRLRDHHKTAEFLTKCYPWALVRETDYDNIPRCGTWWLAQDADMKPISDSIPEFVDLVDEWDTWKWVDSGNKRAKKLNSLFEALGEDEFTSYIMSAKAGDSLFNKYTETVIDVHTLATERTKNKCLSRIKIASINIDSVPYTAGIIFCNDYISDVCESILQERPDLDLLFCVNLPNGVSVRTKKDIDLSIISKKVTGYGGGHPHSAGANILPSQLNKLLVHDVKSLSSGHITIETIE